MLKVEDPRTVLSHSNTVDEVFVSRTLPLSQWICLKADLDRQTYSRRSPGDRIISVIE